MADGRSVSDAAPKVVAIVPNFRLAEATLAVLAALQEVRCPGGLHVVLVDDGSADGSAERLAAAVADDPHAELLALGDNLGYCAAMNRGVARAHDLGARYVLFLNNDVRLDPDFLAPLAACLDHDPSLAGVGPTIVTPDGRAWSEGGDVGFRSNLVFLRNQGGEPAPIDHGPEAVRFLPGACALYRATDLAAVGGVDDRYWMYWEDVDLGDRIRARDRKLLWLPWVRIVHEVSLSSGGGRSALRKYTMAANAVRWLRQHGRVRDWVAFWWFEVVLYPLTFVSGTGVRAAVAKGRGTFDGLRGRRLDTRAVRDVVG